MYAEATVTGWLWTTFGMSLLSGLVPLVQIEVYLLGLFSMHPELPGWLFGIVTAVGQVIGKTAMYFAGRGSFALGERIAQKQRQRASRWAKWLEKFHDNCEQRPYWALGLLACSAFLGLPPFGIMCFLAGTGGVPFGRYLIVTLSGRIARFVILVNVPALLHYLAGWP